jgi:hypothetical protein
MSSARWSLGEQDPKQPSLGGDCLTWDVSEEPKTRLLVWAAGCLSGFSKGQQNPPDGDVTAGPLERQEPDHCVSFGPSFIAKLSVQQESAYLLLGQGSLTSLPSEQHDFEHLLLTGGSLVGLSFEEEETTWEFADGFLIDLALSPMSLRRRTRFWAARSLMTEPLPLQEPSELRRRE